MTTVPLHNHSEFSSLDGMSTVEEIARRVGEMGCPCCGLTDHGVVAGHLDFAKALEKAGVKPVFGCELYHGTKHDGFKGRERDQAHLIALAMTDAGLRNLWCLTNETARPENFHNVGRVFNEHLEKYHEGIVFTSACALGLVPKGLLQGDTTWLNWYLELLGDDFYIELSTYPGDVEFNDRDLDGQAVTTKLVNSLLVEVAQERGVPLVYGDDGHYAFPEQYELHDMYLALQTGQSIYTPIDERTMYHPPGAVCMKDEATVRKALDYLPESVVDEAIANAVALGERANAQLPAIRRHMPAFIPGDSPFLEEEQMALGAEELFIDLVVAGIYKRYGDDPAPEVWARVHHEVETCLNDGLHHYLLWGWDEVTFCDYEGIARGPGRGSSAGCICAYALGITDVDPLHYDLIFERFWNSGRADGFPDIDSDFSQARRQEVIQYLEARLGVGSVVAIGTVGRMKPKAVIDRLGRGTGVTSQEVSELKAIVGKTHDIEIHGVDQIGWDPEIEPGKVIYVKDDVGEEIDKWIEAERGRTKVRQRFVDLCAATCSRVQLYGVHPSGVVISDVPTADELPAYRRGGKKGVPATQFPMDDVDKRQFVKLDVLGLRTLDTLEHWRTMMREDRGLDITWSGLDRESQPDDMWEMLSNGFTAGIFQVETPSGKRLVDQMGVHNLEDLIALNALNRPGPNIERYLDKRNGKTPITYPHDRLEELLHPILVNTYGEFVYQEQVIHYYNALGYTLNESDAIRKILGKKKPEALSALHDGDGEWKGRGYMEMTGAAGVPQGPAQVIWDSLERFASYSFNRSHAAAYALIGYRCLFAKYYGPAQFYASCVRTAEGDKRHEMLPVYVNEARRLGIEVNRPSIVFSQGACRVDGEDNIWFGFGDVKGVGESGDYFAELRDRLPWETPEAFYERFEAENAAYLKAKAANKKLALKGLDDEIVELEEKSPKQKLGAQKIQAIFQAGAWDDVIEPDAPMATRQALEEELLGVILTDCTAEAFEANAEEIAGCDDPAEVRRPFLEKCPEFEMDPVDKDSAFRYEVCGIVTGTQEKRGKKSGKSFGIVTIECGQHELEFVVFNSQWKSYKFLFRIRNPGIFVLKQTGPTEYGESYQFLEGRLLKP